MVQLDSVNVNFSNRCGNEIDSLLNTQTTPDYVLISLVDPPADENVSNHLTKLDHEIEESHQKSMQII